MQHSTSTFTSSTSRKFTATFNSSPHFFTMLNPYDFGTEITKDRNKNDPLFSEARAAIYASVLAGENKTEIARRFHINRSTVYDTIKRFSKCHTFKSRPRPGRPKTLTDRDERHLVWLALRFPTATWRELLQMSGNRVTETTARKVLRRHNIRKFRCK